MDVIRVRGFFVQIFRKVPLFGGLVDTPWKHQALALKEMGWTTVLATLPIWFFPIMASLMFPSAPTIFDGIWTSIAQGDLYLYSAAIVGPLMFALTTDYVEWNGDSTTAGKIGKLTIAFPYGAWFLSISFILGALCPFFFGFMRYSSLGLIDTVLNSELLTFVSIWFYVIATVAMLLVIAYRNKLQTFVAEAKSDEHDFVAEFLNVGRHERND